MIVAGLLIDAGPVESPVLVEVGPQGSHANHARNPICLDDIFFRVGGAGVGRAVVDLRINSNDTIVDHTWIWRADHGSGVGWNLNTSANGLVVNGNRVTAYGLFVEHHQQYQVLWNGNAGRTYFYQSEIPYDPPDQASYSSGVDAKGSASTGGPPTKSPPESSATKPGASASTLSSAIPTLCSRAPSKCPIRRMSAFIT